MVSEPEITVRRPEALETSVAAVVEGGTLEAMEGAVALVVEVRLCVPACKYRQCLCWCHFDLHLFVSACLSSSGGFGGNFYGNDGYGGNYSHSGSVDWWGN